MLLRPEQYINVLSSSVVIPAGIAISVNALQLLKAYDPMLATPEGIIISVRLSQFENASAPMLVTLDGIDTLDSFLQLENSDGSIFVNPAGSFTLVRAAAEKAFLPIEVTEFGMITLISL